MNTLDIVLLLLIGAVVCMALNKIRKDRKNGKGCLSCGCDCASCSYHCNRTKEE
ncbi:MAG: FeoB-associated Cys-rich membrane protein [Clostridia bacterium]|jgi:hypothetical protein|nr:FeoB-associated Cys-rich membrane protein [Clostridia bacterium]MBQ9289850.1 FeoB-associated Cys-rich membrane protein [Clostridia bacterium]